MRSLQKGVDIDACLGTKANEWYLGDYFEKLHDVLQQYQILTSKISKTDKVGLQLSVMNLHFTSTMENIWGDFVKWPCYCIADELCWWDSLSTFLVVPWDRHISDSKYCSRKQETYLVKLLQAGWMDETHFQVFILQERSKQSNLSLPLRESPPPCWQAQFLAKFKHSLH